MNVFAHHEKIREMALAFPCAFEKPSYGTPGFFVGKKMFARIREDGETLVVYNNDRDEWIALKRRRFLFH